MNFKELENWNYEGIDANLKTSLYEYGLVWKLQANGGYMFYYGVRTDGAGNYTLFDWGTVEPDEDGFHPEEEWNFADFDAVARFSGVSKEEFLNTPLPMIVFDLIAYYGHDNIFGSSYYPFTIDK